MRPGVWVLMICFLILPFISWLYIRNGVDFRLNALKELNQKIDISRLDSLVVDNLVINNDSLKRKVWIFIKVEEALELAKSREIASTIYDQNDGSRSVKVVFCTSGEIQNKFGLKDFLTKRKFISFAPISTFDALQNIFVQRDSFSINRFAVNALIIDNKGFIRRGYNLGDAEELKKLVQHSAILIPEYKKEKPQLVRQESY